MSAQKKKDPKKQKAGRARWLGISAKERREIAVKGGKKGAKALWKKYKLTPVEA